jgi:hypothetical protein
MDAVAAVAFLQKQAAHDGTSVYEHLARVLTKARNDSLWVFVSVSRLLACNLAFLQSWVWGSWADAPGRCPGAGGEAVWGCGLTGDIVAGEENSISSSRVSTAGAYFGAYFGRLMPKFGLFAGTGLRHRTHNCSTISLSCFVA